MAWFPVDDLPTPRAPRVDYGVGLALEDPRDVALDDLMGRENGTSRQTHCRRRDRRRSLESRRRRTDADGASERRGPHRRAGGGDLLLTEMGFQHAPKGFSVPASVGQVERVDQVNMPLVASAPSGEVFAQYLRDHLEEMGYEDRRRQGRLAAVRERGLGRQLHRHRRPERCDATHRRRVLSAS